VKVTEEERELLNHLMEECAEVIQAANKCIRYGFDAFGPNAKVDNLEHLFDEISDVITLSYELETALNESVSDRFPEKS